MTRRAPRRITALSVIVIVIGLGAATLPVLAAYACAARQVTNAFTHAGIE